MMQESGYGSLLQLHKDDDEETGQLRFKLLAKALSDCGDAGIAATDAVLQDLDPRDLSIFAALAIMLGYRGHMIESCYLRSGFDATNCDCRKEGRGAYGVNKGGYKPIMEMWEARAFVAAHYALTRGEDEEERCRMGDREEYDPRAAHLAMMFLAVPISDLDWVVGRLYRSLNKFAVARRNLSFDGIKFQVHIHPSYLCNTYS